MMDAMVEILELHTDGLIKIILLIKLVLHIKHMDTIMVLDVVLKSNVKIVMHLDAILLISQKSMALNNTE